MARLSLSLLGAFDTRLNGEPVVFPTDKARALLAYLAVEADHPHRRDALAGLLWPDQPQRKARQNLRQALSYVHKALAAPGDDACIENPVLLVTRETIQFNREYDHTLDTARFDALYMACREHRHLRLGACLPCLRRCEAMVSLFRGEFLEQFFLGDSDVFEEWTLFKREGYHLHVVEALALLARFEARRGNVRRALEYVQRQVTLEPWREDAHRYLMRLLAQEGRYNAALMQYEKCRRILDEALTVEPTAETTALYEEIRARRSGSAAFDAHQPAVAHNLPHAATSFVGREADLRELAGMIASPDCRLITLVGPGGIGKSRLARQVAEEHVGAFAHGVWMVLPAAADTFDALVSAIVDALDVVVPGAQDRTARLFDHLRERELLLVLDGVEHLDEDRARFLARLLRAAPGVVVMATSRERLNLRGEWTYRVRGLDYSPLGAAPDDDVVRCDAITLFVRRAQQVDHHFVLADENFAAVARICELAEGMPLAVELAAAWVAARSCDEIAAAIARNLDVLVTRMRDVPERHRSVRVAFEHSWQRLTDAEQRLFARLAVFVGGFGRDSAVAVAGAMPETLAALLDKSLLRREAGGRYAMHALLRQYAVEKLHADSQMDAAARVEHARYFMAFAADLEPALQKSQPQAALALLAPELGNVREAWQTVVASGRADAVDGAVESLYTFFDLRCRFQEGIDFFSQVPGTWADTPALCCAYGKVVARRGALARHLDQYRQAHDDLVQALAIAERCDRPAERVFCLTNLAEVLRLQGDYPASLEKAHAALALAEHIADHAGLITAYHLLGMVHYRMGDIAQAEAFLNQSLTVARKDGNPRLTMSPLNALGDVMCHKGDYVEAERLFEACLALSRELGGRHNVAVHLNNLGTTIHLQERLEAARPYYRESLEICREIGDQEGQAIALSNLGEIAFALDAPHEAQKLYRAGLDIGRRLHDRWTMMACLDNLGEITCRLEDYAAAQVYLVEALHIARETRTMPMVLRILGNLGALLASQGRGERAALVLSVVGCHPASEQLEREQARQRLAALGLPEPNCVPVSFDALVDEILAELV